jgi:hypothetical protein|tara:strand:- start:298 stop:609 length:312 start_codon:yes stop_codon:yes gene_type:complete
MNSILTQHPMHSLDRPIVDSIRTKQLKDLTNQDIADLARLLIRYSSYPGKDNLKQLIISYLHENGKTPEQLQVKAREIWQSGWRPGQVETSEVGSGADVEYGA